MIVRGSFGGDCGKSKLHFLDPKLLPRLNPKPEIPDPIVGRSFLLVGGAGKLVSSGYFGFRVEGLGPPVHGQ